MRHKIWIASSDAFQAALLLACAWGKIEWYWFWIVLFLQSLEHWGFETEMKKERAR